MALREYHWEMAGLMGRASAQFHRYSKLCSNQFVVRNVSTTHCSQDSILYSCGQKATGISMLSFLSGARKLSVLLISSTQMGPILETLLVSGVLRYEHVISLKDIQIQPLITGSLISEGRIGPSVNQVVTLLRFS